jgi:hypothetical protein
MNPEWGTASKKRNNKKQKVGNKKNPFVRFR